MFYRQQKWLQTKLSSIGIEVRRTSQTTGLDPIHDLKILSGDRTIKTIVDIGANVGQSALLYRESFPQAVIHSFEPVVKTFEAGRKNTAQHSAITWHNVAVGNESKRIVFYSEACSQLNSITHGDAKNSQEQDRNEVELIRFDDFAAANQLGHIDLLKTDTEGLDLAVLEGAKATLTERKISYILVEVGFSKTDKGHSAFSPIADYLGEFGYSLVCFYGLSHLEHFRRYGVVYADALFAKVN